MVYSAKGFRSRRTFPGMQRQGRAVAASNRGRCKVMISRTEDGKANGARIIIREFGPEEFEFN
jgi:hypothetical protein